ncbi:hypothetical protein [Mycolicibacterium brisbanense]|uniref:tRNA/rRNA methyltransferase n=1 Tax=Mycolicibacterium brisbanense TaxID=146020 RepID=A0A100W6W1_9MYCO|nr:hypothetical protein [Mycolicibacterium brisbanense]MCV7158019.1 hypothetical protein [Mycolicibacterium brisbanense]GAS92668.1 tRNA/rRNA methyltransferase [Mycolicibacterium brisbanense]
MPDTPAAQPHVVQDASEPPSVGDRTPESTQGHSGRFRIHKTDDPIWPWRMDYPEPRSDCRLGVACSTFDVAVEELVKALDEYCHCGHEWLQHRVSAYGHVCAVPCGGLADYGDGIDRCHCVRWIAMAEVPAEVRPFSERNVHPLRRSATARDARNEGR